MLGQRRIIGRPEAEILLLDTEHEIMAVIRLYDFIFYLCTIKVSGTGGTMSPKGEPDSGKCLGVCCDI